jgi:biopolymer transport protein ExbD
VFEAQEASLETVVEINVTPMIDVLLSLLIIFMVAAPPPPNHQQPLSLPQQTPVETSSSPNATLLVEIAKDGSMKLGEEPLSDDYTKMVEQLRANEKAQADQRIAVKADESVAYGKVIVVMSAAREAEIGQVGIASDRI